MTVPAGTAEGTYCLLACADDLARVVEENESNNCASSATRVVIETNNCLAAATAILIRP